jgi:hypothetical protein
VEKDVERGDVPGTEDGRRRRRTFGAAAMPSRGVDSDVASARDVDGGVGITRKKTRMRSRDWRSCEMSSAMGRTNGGVDSTAGWDSDDE